MSTRPPRTRSRPLHSAFALVWGMVLAMTMFTLSYPDCTQAAEQPLSLAVFAEDVVFTDVTPKPLATAANCSWHAMDASTAIDPQHDLPDLDLAPDRTPRLGCSAVHAMVACPGGPDQSALAHALMRPPDLA